MVDFLLNKCFVPIFILGGFLILLRGVLDFKRIFMHHSMEKDYPKIQVVLDLIMGFVFFLFGILVALGVIVPPWNRP